MVKLFVNNLEYHIMWLLCGCISGRDLLFGVQMVLVSVLWIE